MEGSTLASDKKVPGQKTEVLQVEVDADQVGRRLDNFLLSLLPGIPRSLVYKIIRDGQVRVLGKRSRPYQRLSRGDRVRVPPIFHNARKPHCQTAAKSLDWLCKHVLAEESGFLIMNKPPGIPVHAGSGLGYGLVDMLETAGILVTGKHWLVHRLDRDTSGCLVIAKSYREAHLLHQQFASGQVEKHYLALALGRVDAKQEIFAPLEISSDGSLPKVRVSSAGKSAHTTFSPLEPAGDAHTLLKVQTHTGRMHQIRVHAAHWGHPLAGDSRYGDFMHNRFLKKSGLHRIFLHATGLSFKYEGKNQRFETPLPPDLEKVLANLNQTGPPKQTHSRLI